MSRIAAAYLNIPLDQLDNFASLRRVFARNTSVIISQAMLLVEPTPELNEMANMLKASAHRLAESYGDKERFAKALVEFRTRATELRGHLLKQPNASDKTRQISLLGAHPINADEVRSARNS